MLSLYRKHIYLIKNNIIESIDKRNILHDIVLQYKNKTELNIQFSCLKLPDKIVFIKMNLIIIKNHIFYLFLVSI